jgi:hypothetical protein
MSVKRAFRLSILLAPVSFLSVDFMPFENRADAYNLPQKLKGSHPAAALL